MRKVRKIIVKGLIVYLIYLIIFALLVFKIPLVYGSNLSYDVNEMITSSNANSYAYLVEDIDEAMNVRLGLIEEAKETIDLAYYVYGNDEAGQIITGALLNSANKGIKVRIIVNGLNFTKRKMFKVLNAHENISLYSFEPLSLLLVHKNQNNLHDKIMLIDKNYSLVGGRNISNRFLLGKDGNITQDRDVLSYSSNETSEVGVEIKDYFEQLTTSKHTKEHKTLYKESYSSYSDEVIAKYENHRLNGYDLQEALLDAVAVERATFVRSPLNTYNKEPILMNVVEDLISLRSTVVIQSPYITSSYLMKMHFNLDKDKDVKILTNNMTTNPNLPALSGYVRTRKKLANNYQLYELQNDYSDHAKTVTIGNDISIIGSQNMDHRSLFLNTESAIVIYSKEFQDVLNLEINELLKASLIVNKDGSYISDNNVIPVKKKKGKALFVKISSWLSFFFDEMLIKYNNK